MTLSDAEPLPHRSILRIITTIGGVVVLASLVATGCGPRAEPSPPGTKSGVQVMAIEDGKLTQKTINPSPKKLGPPPIIVPSPLTFIGMIEFASGEGGFAALTGSGKQGFGVYVVKLDTGAVAGMVPLKGLGGNPAGRAVSPDGKQLAIIVSNSGGLPETLHLSAVADGRKIGSFKPHYDPKTRQSNLLMAHYVAPDKLLTVTDTGGFAVWAAADQSQLLNVPGELKPGSINRRWPSLTPPGFDLSEDGKRLALFDGRGFTFHDTATGKPAGKTERIPAEGDYAVGVAALRADGSRLAAMFHVGSKKPPTNLVVVWDTRTGKKLAEFKPEMDEYPDRSNVQWFGPDHVLVRYGGGWKNQVWSVENPRQVTQIVTYTLPGSPGDKLWAHVGRSNVLGREPPDAPKFLIHADPPPLGEQPKLWFTYRGFSPTVPLD